MPRPPPLMSRKIWPATSYWLFIKSLPKLMALRPVPTLQLFQCNCLSTFPAITNNSKLPLKTPVPTPRLSQLPPVPTPRRLSKLPPKVPVPAPRRFSQRQPVIPVPAPRSHSQPTRPQAKSPSLCLLLSEATPVAKTSGATLPQVPPSDPVTPHDPDVPPEMAALVGTVVAGATTSGIREEEAHRQPGYAGYCTGSIASCGCYGCFLMRKGWGYNPRERWFIPPRS